MIHETLAGLRPLLSSEDMEVQERAHNATALLHVVLRRVAPSDPALPDTEAATDEVTTLVQHEQRCVCRFILIVTMYLVSLESGDQHVLVLSSPYIRCYFQK